MMGLSVYKLIFSVTSVYITMFVMRSISTVAVFTWPSYIHKQITSALDLAFQPCEFGSELNFLQWMCHIQL